MNKYHRSKEIKLRLKKLEETYPQISGMAMDIDGDARSWLPSWWGSFPHEFCADNGINSLAALHAYTTKQ